MKKFTLFVYNGDPMCFIHFNANRKPPKIKPPAIQEKDPAASDGRRIGAGTGRDPSTAGQAGG
jgi:hypothetical protein